MDHPETFPVKPVDWAGRPGDPNSCFRCHRKVGEEHAADCVERTRTVMLKVTIEVMQTVPQNWSKDTIEFARNEGSWCSENILDDLIERHKWARPGECTLCSRTEITFSREATEEDERDWYLDKENPHA